MKQKEIINIIETMAPLATAEVWDNPGWQLKGDKQEIKKVLVALEINDDVVDEAIENGVDLVVTHHPMFFHPIGAVNADFAVGNWIIKLASNGISVYASHTPFDKCEGGNNEYFGKVLGLENIQRNEFDKEGYMRTGELPNAMNFPEITKFLSEKLGVAEDIFHYAGDRNAKFKKLAWATGAGGENGMFIAAKRAGADLFITGDVGHHKAWNARNFNVNVIDATHFGTENIFVENMANILAKAGDLVIIKSKANANPWV